jgi:membrane protease YdiL (CAAX protease family)
VRPDLRLLAAALAPLLVWQWIPPWDVSIFSKGWAGAVVFCVSVAVLEEVIFRGGIQGWLLQKAYFKSSISGFSRANWATSSLFAFAHVILHPAWLVPGYFAVSLVLGYFRERYRGILVPVLLHAYYNLVLLFFPQFFG